MAVIEKSRNHDLNPEQAKAAAEGVVVHFADKFGAKYEWKGETVTFKGAGAKGQMTVYVDRVELRLELGLMLRPLGKKIENSVDKYLDEFCSQ